MGKKKLNSPPKKFKIKTINKINNMNFIRGNNKNKKKSGIKLVKSNNKNKGIHKKKII